MNSEINTLIQRIEMVNTGEPWFGKNVYKILDEVKTEKSTLSVTLNKGEPSHTCQELIWHMNTWAEFTLKRIEKDTDYDPAAAEKQDWRTIDTIFETWRKGVSTFKELQQKIIDLLKEKEDSFLDEKVDYREYNFRFLINGMIEHNIYHAAQIAFAYKLLNWEVGDQ